MMNFEKHHANQKETPVLCSSYKVFRIRKSIYRESELVSVVEGRSRGRKVTAGGRGFLFREAEMV